MWPFDYLASLIESVDKLWLVISLIMISLVGYYSYIFISKMYSNKDTPNLEFGNDGDENNKNAKFAELTFFTASWCPHCKTAIPEWNRFKETYNNKIINGYKLVFNTIDCSNDKDPEIQSKLDKFKVGGFPTIKLLKDRELIDYEAQPSYNTLEEFIKTVLN